MGGVVTLSVELELGWGMHDMDDFSHLSDDRSPEERALSRLLDSCDHNDLEFSFDVVGHLFHESCDGQHDGPYPSSWWENDPGSSYHENPQFYSPDLISKIIDNPVGHEICTHTYSHILAEQISPDLLDYELNTVEDIHERWNLPSPTSIVMPRHQDVDYSILSNHGIKTIRRPIKDYGKSESNPIEKLWWLLMRDHPKCEILTTKGITETTCTPHPSLSSTLLPSGQKKASPYFQIFPRKVREYLHHQYLMDAIELAAKKEDHTHLWTHLNNIANDSQWRVIKPALDYLGELQKQNEIEIYTMRNLPEMA